MKSDAATVWIVNRIGEKVIEVDEHRGEHDEPSPAPSAAKENPRHGSGNSRVKNQMGDCKFDQSLARRRRKALLTTDTGLIAIAAPAKMGERSTKAKKRFCFTAHRGVREADGLGDGTQVSLAEEVLLARMLPP